ncbi:hypothetical protein [Thermomicrobium sp.]
MRVPNERSGDDVLEQLSEIWPSAAPPRVQPVFEDLRTALRIPDIPFPFRILAHWPPYLAFAVRQFSPFIRSLAFEAAADALRARAAASIGSLPRSERLAAARALILREHELAPKIVLILTAFAVGLRGRSGESAPPLGTTLPPQEPLAVRPAELPRTVDERIAPLPDLSTARERGRVLLADLAALRGSPALDDFSRALAISEPAAFAELLALRRSIQADRLAQGRSELLAQAERAIRRFTLPGSKVLPDFMVPEHTLAAIDAVVDQLRTIALEALLDVTLARIALDGLDAASSAPYPVLIAVEQ